MYNVNTIPTDNVSWTDITPEAPDQQFRINVKRGNDAGLMHNGENTAVVVIMPMRVKEIGNYQGFNESFPDPLTAMQLAA
jgi:hypothetical protein